MICTQLIAVSLCGCGGCFNDYNFVGTVADNNNVLLADVQVSIILPGYDGYVLEATTDSDGQYRLSSKSRGGYDGFTIKFEKIGYQTVEVEPFLTSEASSLICGSITLRRDAVLYSQQTNTLVN